MSDLYVIEGIVMDGLEGVRDEQKRSEYVNEARDVFRRYRLLFDGKLLREDERAIREYGNIYGPIATALLFLRYMKERCG